MSELSIRQSCTEAQRDRNGAHQSLGADDTLPLAHILLSLSDTQRDRETDERIAALVVSQNHINICVHTEQKVDDKPS